MTDPVAALGQFTPAGPNRDELLFAAGRAAARPSRWWRAVAELLAVTQAVTLAVWLWPKEEPRLPPVPSPTPPAVVPEPAVEPGPSSPLDPHSYLALMHRDDASDPREPFAPAPDRPTRPLTAGSRQFD